MAKASWNDVMAYKPSMLTNRVPMNRIPGRRRRPMTESGAALPMGHVPLPAVPLPFREPQKLDLDGVRWFAVRTTHASERALQADLEGMGYRVYCPLVTKWLWRNGNRTKDKRQTPVFARYIFVGCRPDQHVSRRTTDGIESVLGRQLADGIPLTIPPAALKAINDLDLAGVWDETIEWSPDKSPFQHGAVVRICAGPFLTMQATVDAPTSEKTIRLLITLLGRETAAEFDACNLELV